MTDKIDDVNIEAKKALDDLRATIDKYGSDSVEAKSRMDKMEDVFKKQEEKSQEIVTQQAADRKAADELKQRVEDLELELATKQNEDPNFKDSAEYKALSAFVQKGALELEAEQKQLLRTDDNVSGGYLTTPDMDTEIIRSITELSPVRSVARVKSVSNKILQIPVRTGIPTATYEGEAAAGGKSTSKYGNETLAAYRQTVTIPFTRDQLMDSEFDLMSEINQDVSEAFAQGEGKAMVLGTGAKEPEGFLSAAAGLINDPNRIRATGSASELTADSIVQITGDLKVGYQPIYAMNRRTLAIIRTLKDTAGAYIFQQGIPGLTEASLGGGVPNTIAGVPYVLFEDMPDVAANAFPIAYADFTRGFRIIDRTGMEMIRDDYTRKAEAIVEMTFNRWNTGQVVLPEAFHLLQVASS
jgi:HK97 family phage major capsid protein